MPHVTLAPSPKGSRRARPAAESRPVARRSGVRVHLLKRAPPHKGLCVRTPKQQRGAGLHVHGLPGGQHHLPDGSANPHHHVKLPRRLHVRRHVQVHRSHVLGQRVAVRLGVVLLLPAEPRRPARGKHRAVLPAESLHADQALVGVRDEAPLDAHGRRVQADQPTELRNCRLPIGLSAAVVDLLVDSPKFLQAALDALIVVSGQRFRRV
mmetsp:Transcript_10070/g.39211  ORF Transcript_10070/g.39211 Transcript_10070/m.39211 type:complete len:209 (-) Transcript_10070:155-781(-)